MSSEIVPRPDQLRLRGRSPSRRVRRAAAEIGEDALLDGVRIIGRAYVAQVALSNIDLITNEEARYVSRHPLTEHRFRAIGEAFAGYAARQAAGMGF